MRTLTLFACLIASTVLVGCTSSCSGSELKPTFTHKSTLRTTLPPDEAAKRAAEVFTQMRFQSRAESGDSLTAKVTGWTADNSHLEVRCYLEHEGDTGVYFKSDLNDFEHSLVEKKLTAAIAGPPLKP